MPATPHLPGRIPATTALRVLLRHAGRDYTEPLLYLLAGGIGAGVFAFQYEKEDFASLFLAGRHLWADDTTYLTAAAKRLGLRTAVKESTSAGAAEKQLREALIGGRPVIAWVDAAHLPHRAMPARYSGGGYHVVTVYGIEGDAALIGDRAPEPIRISLRDLGIARQRIAKQRNRLLWLDGAAPGRAPTAAQMLADARKTCVTTLRKAKMTNFRLDAFAELADRMQGGTGKESWEKMFPPGPRLWTALTSLGEYIDYYGTGGGLCRAIFAEGLAEAGLAEPAASYARLGARWSAIARAALPDTVPAMREARELTARKHALLLAGAPAAEVRACWEGLARLAAEAKKRFPLAPAEAAGLRQELGGMVRQAHQEELAALDQLA